MKFPVRTVIAVLNILQLSKTDRRITDGKQVLSEKAYVVYLTKAPRSNRTYDFWLCGGALVSPWNIITSAACVEDVEFMYAIAGYNKYVPFAEINNDECTKHTKKKVVLSCVPKSYEFDFVNVSLWAYNDIAVVRVESEFNFNDSRYKTTCSYKPRIIDVNYDEYEKVNADVLAMGWGHNDKWRKPEDPIDYNQKNMQYTAIRTENKNYCKPFFASVRGLDVVIDRFMICTHGAGNIDENGKVLTRAKISDDECTPNATVLAKGTVECEEDTDMNSRKRFRHILERPLNRTRRAGICQNDHGGPLVTWMNNRETLIGVASVFRVYHDLTCTGPYLFTGTHYNKNFLRCNIWPRNGVRDSICDRPARELGYEVVERKISWRNHTDGPADNEVIRARPQKPMNLFYFLNSTMSAATCKQGLK